MAWRYFATRLHGDGTETIIDHDLPLSDVSITPRLNAGMEMSGVIPDAYPHLIASDGFLALEPWSTAVYAEEDGIIRGGGIYTEESLDSEGGEWAITLMGFADYPAGQPFVDSWLSTRVDQYAKAPEIRSRERQNLVNAVNRARRARDAASGAARAAKQRDLDSAQAKLSQFDAATPGWLAQQADLLAKSKVPGCPTIGDGVDGVDPLDLYRFIWHHLQSKPRGNIGVVCDTTRSGKRLGYDVPWQAYDNYNDGDTPDFEQGAVRLSWYETPDLSQPIRDLADNTPFEFVEEHAWGANRSSIVHRIKFGAPSLGRRRNDVRMVLGENCAIGPWGTTESNDYASEVLMLGSGEGPATKRAQVVRSGDHRIRRAVAVERKDLAATGPLSNAGRQELLYRDGYTEVTSVMLLPSAEDAERSLQLGDEFRLFGETANIKVDQWSKITGISISPDGDVPVTYTVTRVDDDRPARIQTNDRR